MITGKLFDSESGLGAVWTFRLYGFIALAVMVVYIIANMTVFRRPLHVHAPRNMSLQIDANKSGFESLFSKKYDNENHDKASLVLEFCQMNKMTV